MPYAKAKRKKIAQSAEFLGRATCRYDTVTGRKIYERREYFRELPPKHDYDEQGRVIRSIHTRELLRVEEFGHRPEDHQGAADAA